MFIGQWQSFSKALGGYQEMSQEKFEFRAKNDGGSESLSFNKP